jgi:uncharacterized OsmC-like protein
MKNAIHIAGLAEFADEVRQQPEQGRLQYEVSLDWRSGTRADLAAGPMRVGDQRVSRGFAWMVDEPRQLGGSNHAPNPQEFLLGALAGCLMVAFVVAASTRGVQLESLRIDVEAELDLAGFLAVREGAAVELQGIRYRLVVAADADDQLLEEMRALAEARSPNAQTLRAGVPLRGDVRRA